MSQSTTTTKAETMAHALHGYPLFRHSAGMMRFGIILMIFGCAMSPSLTAGTLMSNAPLSIRQSRELTHKQNLKNWIGGFVASVMPARTAQLQAQPAPNPESFVDKVIMFHLCRKAINEKQSDFLERLHYDFWAGEEGAKFSSNCDHRFEDLFLTKQQEDFNVLQAIWESMNGRDLVEIGTNSGLLLEHLTKNLVKVSRSTGIDINQQQIKKNQSADHFDSRIEFRCTDGQQWILDNGNPMTLFVTNGGVLEYFRREKLNEMMTHISTHCSPSIFFASEPVAHDHDFDANLDSIPFGEELSFSHNYRDIFQSNGFNVLHQRAVMFEAWKMQVTIAVTKPTTS
jgi:hypothetical protein